MRRERRRFVRALGAAVGLALAGCSGGDTEANSTSTATGTATDTPAPTGTPSPTATTAATDTPTPTEKGSATEGESGIDDYLSGTSNYDGTVVDRTGRDEVTVAVGAEGNGGGFAFDPAAVRVDPGTTVVWEWTGSGGLHNIVAATGDFDSGEPVSGGAATFEYTVPEAGTWRYYCTPHRALGMKGVLVSR
ncbi:halocyanin domain-containing protein [Haloplanus ruber]|uniref:Halocyanin domain-containing protein n=1 Tax=Haloplanus ruber TaxID=869892 RepID=A0ABD6CVR6_9EURY|nr:halocyanin domain-containing protein [Haloplanus ruber]